MEIGRDEVTTTDSYSNVIWRLINGKWGFLSPSTLTKLKPNNRWKRCSRLIPPGCPPSFIEEVDNYSSPLEGSPSLQYRIRTWYHLTGRDGNHLIDGLCRYLDMKKAQVTAYLAKQEEFTVSSNRVTLLANSVRLY